MRSKSDHVAGPDLVQRWATRRADALSAATDRLHSPFQRDQSLRAARGRYARLPDGAPLGQSLGLFALVTRETVAEMLKVLA